ncbi:kynurenine formamidase [Bombina bombina]|uniref:kynurenine formamidase n=1 Tax=Bombina bombina TaxID=8345 RepID=UPI00235A6BEE|nr:kynurenine formamidase [Bombina bombina]XP_053562156.1 kynurenine formamidase [Bombina bombina]
MEKDSWRELNKEELDHQYSPSHWSHRMDKDAVIEAHVRETTAGTKQARETAETILNVSYGERESEKLDMYLPKGLTSGFPLLIYIHGGFWQFLSKEESGFMVRPLVLHGIGVMVMDYDIAPSGHMDLIVSQVRQSIAVTLKQYSQISGVYLCGHSAGAHLVAMALCTDWSAYGISLEVKGAFLVSGVYDLIPITHTYVNEALSMSQQVAERNSPIRCVMQTKRNVNNCHMVLVVAEHDSPEFHKQSHEYLKSLHASGINVSFMQIDCTDHFDVIEKLSQEDYVLTKLIVDTIIN